MKQSFLHMGIDEYQKPTKPLGNLKKTEKFIKKIL